MMSLIAAIILIALVLLVRSYLKQRNYIRLLYEKNVQLLTPPTEVVVPQLSVMDANESSDIQDESAPKYQGTTLDQESKERLFARIKQVMDDIHIICQPDFSLQSLADLVSSNYKYVYNALSEFLSKSTIDMYAAKIDEGIRHSANKNELHQFFKKNYGTDEAEALYKIIYSDFDKMKKEAGN